MSGVLAARVEATSLSHRTTTPLPVLAFIGVHSRSGCILVAKEAMHMGRPVRNLVMTVAVLSAACLGAQAADAQPLGIGASQGAEQPQYGVLSSQNGRFVFGQISGSNKDQFMLDTATGRLWRMGESGKVGIFLKAVPYLDAEGECTFLPDRVPDPGPKKPDKKQRP